jgi:hypothetical protein
VSALTNSLQTVSQVGEIFQKFHAQVSAPCNARLSSGAHTAHSRRARLPLRAQQLQQAMAMAAPPLTVEQQVSAQRSIEHTLQPPYNVEEHEQLQHKVQELEEWQARQQEQIRAKDAEAERIAEQYRFEHARLQAQHDAAASAAAVAQEETGAQAELAAVRPYDIPCPAHRFCPLFACKRR